MSVRCVTLRKISCGGTVNDDSYCPSMVHAVIILLGFVLVTRLYVVI